MTVLDWLAVISASLGILFFIGIAVLIVLIIGLGRRIRTLKHVRVKNKIKKKKLMKERRYLQATRKKYAVMIFFFFFFSIGGAAGSAYTVYYQSTNLGTKDQEAIVKGYYYLLDIEGEVEAGKARSADLTEVNQNIDILTSRLSAFALYKADYRINSEGQLRLNRYYSGVKQLGINLSSRPKEFYADETQYAEFIQELNKVKESQATVFKMFGVDESSLELKQ